MSYATNDYSIIFTPSDRSQLMANSLLGQVVSILISLFIPLG